MNTFGIDASPEVEELMARIQRQTEEIEQIQRDIAELSVQGYSRDREVTATVQGSGRLTEITIEPATLREFDAYDVGAIVLEAVNDALDRLAETTAARYAPVIDAAPA